MEKTEYNNHIGGVSVGKKDGQTIISSDTTDGGLFVGKSHAEDGGIKTVNKETGEPLLVEGGETILNKFSMGIEDEYICSGSPKDIASKINELKDGGVSWSNKGNCKLVKKAADGAEVNEEINRADDGIAVQYIKEGKLYIITADNEDQAELIEDAMNDFREGFVTKEELENTLQSYSGDEYMIDSSNVEVIGGVKHVYSQFYEGWIPFRNEDPINLDEKTALAENGSVIRNDVTFEKSGDGTWNFTYRDALGTEATGIVKKNNDIGEFDYIIEGNNFNDDSQTTLGVYRVLELEFKNHENRFSKTHVNKAKWGMNIFGKSSSIVGQKSHTDADRIEVKNKLSELNTEWENLRAEYRLGDHPTTEYILHKKELVNRYRPYIDKAISLGIVVNAAILFMPTAEKGISVKPQFNPQPTRPGTYRIYSAKNPSYPEWTGTESEISKFIRESQNEINNYDPNDSWEENIDKLGLTYSEVRMEKREEKASDGYFRSTEVAKRPSPSVSATIFPEGYKMEGNDGNMWVISIASNGVHRWKKNKAEDGSEIEEIEEKREEKIEEVAKFISIGFDTPTSYKPSAWAKAKRYMEKLVELGYITKNNIGRGKGKYWTNEKSDAFGGGLSHISERLAGILVNSGMVRAEDGDIIGGVKVRVLESIDTDDTLDDFEQTWVYYPVFTDKFQVEFKAIFVGEKTEEVEESGTPDTTFSGVKPGYDFFGDRVEEIRFIDDNGDTIELDKSTEQKVTEHINSLFKKYIKGTSWENKPSSISINESDTPELAANGLIVSSSCGCDHAKAADGAELAAKRIYLNQKLSDYFNLPYNNTSKDTIIHSSALLNKGNSMDAWDNEHQEILSVNKDLHLKGVGFGWWEITSAYVNGGIAADGKEINDSGIPADTQEEVNAGRVTYRGMGFGKEGTKIKVHGKEYVISNDKFKELGGISKIKFNAPFRKAADGTEIDSDKIDAILKVGDYFTGEPNGAYEESYQLSIPRTSYILEYARRKSGDPKTYEYKVISVAKTPADALNERYELERHGKSNLKVHWAPFTTAADGTEIIVDSEIIEKVKKYLNNNNIEHTSVEFSNGILTINNLPTFFSADDIGDKATEYDFDYISKYKAKLWLPNKAANGKKIEMKGMELWFSPDGRVKVEPIGKALDVFEGLFANMIGVEGMDLVNEAEQEYVFELMGNQVTIDQITPQLEERGLDIETYGSKKRIHIPRQIVNQTLLGIRYPLLTPFANGGGIKDWMDKIGITDEDLKWVDEVEKEEIDNGVVWLFHSIYETEAEAKEGEKLRELEDYETKTLLYNGLYWLFFKADFNKIAADGTEIDSVDRWYANKNDRMKLNECLYNNMAWFCMDNADDKRNAIKELDKIIGVSPAIIKKAKDIITTNDSWCFDSSLDRKRFLDKVFPKAEDGTVAAAGIEINDTDDNLANSILRKAVMGNFITLEKANQRSTQVVAMEVSGDHRDDEEIGSSDMTFILKEFLDGIRVETYWENGTRLALKAKKGTSISSGPVVHPGSYIGHLNKTLTQKGFDISKLSKEQKELILMPSEDPEGYSQDGEITDSEAMSLWLHKLSEVGLHGPDIKKAVKINFDRKAKDGIYVNESDGVKTWVGKGDNGKWTVFSESKGTPSFPHKWEKRNEFESGFASKEDAINAAKLQAGVTEEDPEALFMQNEFSNGGNTGYEIALSAEPNPDYDSDSHEGLVNIPERKVPSKSVKEARDLAVQFIIDNELGSGNWTGGQIYHNGKPIAHVSYNGRIWEGNAGNTDYKEFKG